MCGIVGVISKAPVNQLIYDALLLLQHRGQDAAGIVTMQDSRCFMHKARGMVRDVFRTRNMRNLPGNVGLGQVRYPTAGNAFSEEEAQPFYVNAPFGIVLVHNGNLTNAPILKDELSRIDRRHINTDSDTEVLINILAHELEFAARDRPLTPEIIFNAVAAVHKRLKGSYAVVALIAGFGLLAFRDPYGIRPLCFGEGDTPEGRQVMVASESVALEGTGHALTRDVAPGEAVFITPEGRVHARQCAENPSLHPCMFEYVYLARPDSVMDGISVYQARLNMGETLAQRLISTMPPSEIDVVIPIPESSRPSAMQLAQKIGKPYREGFVKNRYVVVPSSCRGRAFARNPCVRNSTPSASSSRAATSCWSMTRSCAATPRKRSFRWHVRRVRARSTWPRRRRPCDSPMSMASTCRPRMNWWRTTAPWKKSGSSSAPTR